jgi:hypothetical protein
MITQARRLRYGSARILNSLSGSYTSAFARSLPNLSAR